jgi:hypothetical protein
MVLAAHPNETGGDGVGLGTRREAEGKIKEMASRAISSDENLSET